MTEMNGQPIKQLRRTKDGRIVAGVCSGVGRYIGIDPNILRIALAVASFFGGLGIGIYAVAWLLVPEEDREQSIVQDLINKQQAKSRERQESPWHEAPQTPVPPQAPPAAKAPTDTTVGTGSSTLGDQH